MTTPGLLSPSPSPPKGQQTSSERLRVIVIGSLSSLRHPQHRPLLRLLRLLRRFPSAAIKIAHEVPRLTWEGTCLCHQPLSSAAVCTWSRSRGCLA
ncbi:hypothetical protein H112_08879 [Trichophyton rubrum D6]|uniref:Uncharacterized protein n=2 Tax=Trichophyton TaxID=5550 RepID=A0A022VLX3_TRIRU|nr:hypothetical protein H100_08900 [Trichophyton rubrum MR850]EZF36720.1 hypothetical protein H102_08861 [Trichophyton rubrum CBS 100081]EZF47312.1 hypothetical protein H103_08883 [Trichophyton rubrum CBS 288.86]EZF58050.1 hypothetical protein H104_08831 [Trichophyton rubrum CBS 289.86]EZF68556.1 hypothetical protein H105_08887 [Trichophyton soudanense CBS 452.61]EZF79268.1 hypothetical protein H110_08884 [Trichophyton rubrum MR1448]EZF89867.1 hypothetical protein H113_08950 [Trichophyton rub